MSYLEGEFISIVNHYNEPSCQNDGVCTQLSSFKWQPIVDNDIEVVTPEELIGSAYLSELYREIELRNDIANATATSIQIEPWWITNTNTGFLGARISWDDAQKEFASMINLEMVSTELLEVRLGEPTNIKQRNVVFGTVSAAQLESTKVPFRE